MLGFQGTESVVFSDAVSENVVTVTTQPAEGDTDQLELPRSMLGAEGKLCIKQGLTLRKNSFAEQG